VPRDGRTGLGGWLALVVGMVGYSQYAPSKYALRGLADCLRNELLVSPAGARPRPFTRRANLAR
jgi:NAD(P)-dependent dehydrogenase (short-subunit alcohol dehydrogenase family)